MTTTKTRLTIPCMKCQQSIGAEGAFYMPYKERQRNAEGRKRQSDFEARKRAQTGGLVVWSMSEMHEFLAPQARWQIHCLPCMAPCYDHPDDEDDKGCGGTYWFDGDRADTWPKIAHWTAHLMGKNWFADTDWDGVLYYLLGHNGGREA